MEARWLLKNVKAAYKTSDQRFCFQIQNVVLELSNDRGDGPNVGARWVPTSLAPTL